ncbi:MAG TPA: hypothetical protein VD766_01335, partial [Solirubrobacterales bacterium]|nr:hypothetical protein [Solirubrobacterales bacterium]
MSDPATLSAADYLLGAGILALITGAFAFAAVRVRRAVLPGFSGPPALVADTIAFLTLAIVTAEILGTFSAFTELGMILGALAVATIAALTLNHPQRGLTPGLTPPAEKSRTLRDSTLNHPQGGLTPGLTPPAPPAHRLGLTIVAIVVAVIFAGWAIPTLSGITSGMGRADTLWYHMPLSLRFADTGSTGELFFFDPIFFASFYPANSEVLHAIPILAFDRDFLSPLFNLGFLALGLISGWAIGRPYGVAPQALLGAAVVLGAETMVDFQAGEALNDVTGVVLLLACVALLVNGRAARPDASIIGAGPLIFAGAAAGLAAGTKLSFLAPVALLTLGIFVFSRGARLRSTAIFSLPML